MSAPETDLEVTQPRSLAVIQAETDVWQRRNFPDATYVEMMVGVVEEVGETAQALGVDSPDDMAMVLRLASSVGRFAHATLKAHQGIRGTPEQHAADADEAIRDLASLLQFWIGIRRISVRSHRQIPHWDGAMDRPKVVDGIGDTLVYLTNLCSKLGVQMDETLETTWAEVQARDWLTDPMKGGTA